MNTIARTADANKAPTLTADLVAKALSKTSSGYLPADRIDLMFGRFDHARAQLGKHVACSAADWIAGREAAGKRLWPEIGNKKSLPGEIGALLAQRGTTPVDIGRLALDVLAFTWIFIDVDDGQMSTELRLQLREIGIFFLCTESSTSRYDGNGPKWHLILPLSQPKHLSSTGFANVDKDATLRARKVWWHRVHEHVARAMFALGRLDWSEPSEGEARAGDDVSVRTFGRLAFIPHAPIEEQPRLLVAPAGGRLLDLDAFLKETGFEDVEPPIVELGKASRGAVVPKAAAPTAAATDDDDDDDDDDEAPVVGPSLGETPNETTGTLMYKALKYFGLVDPGPELEPGKRRALCPWRHEHSTTSEHDPQGFMPGDTSVVFWTRDEESKPGGGWKCAHSGSGSPGECVQSTAADVLRWARKNGCPLPDRPSFGGKVADAPSMPSPSPKEAATKKQDPLPPEFPGAPDEGTPPPIPRSRWETRDVQDKVEIEVTLDAAAPARMRDLAIKAISRHPDFYRTDGRLFDLVEPEADVDRNGFASKPWIRKTVAKHLEAEVGTVSVWYKLNKKCEAHPCGVPDVAIGAVLAAGRYPGVRDLHGIITSPVFRPDGTLLQQAGYDPTCAVIYRPQRRGIPLISQNPSRAELKAAKGLLLGITGDFPFRGSVRDPVTRRYVGGTADLARAVWLSAPFSRFLRFAGVNRNPLLGVSAGLAGSGKGLFCDTATVVSEGALAWKRTKAGDDAEIERAIGAAIKEEVPVMCLDNIPRGMSLASATLENYLTTGVFTTREIGTSNNLKGIKGAWTDTLWWATGNGLQTGGDMKRRTLMVHIDDKTGRPEERVTERQDLEGWCLDHYPELAAAALTLLSGFFAARRGGWRVTLPAFASFEKWRLVREAVVWCGLPDPALAQAKAEDDVDAGGEGYLMEHLLNLSGGKAMYVGAAAELLRKDKPSAKPQYLAIFNFLSDQGVKLGAQTVEGAQTSLGCYLRKFKGKSHAYSDKVLQLCLDSDGGGSYFRVDVV